MTPEEQVRRGKHADMLANDDLFKDAVKKLRDDAMSQFKTAKTHEEFLAARAQYDATESFVNVFIGLVRDGQFAQRKIMDAAKPPLKSRDRYQGRHASPIP